MGGACATPQNEQCVREGVNDSVLLSTFDGSDFLSCLRYTIAFLFHSISYVETFQIILVMFLNILDTRRLRVLVVAVSWMKRFLFYR